MRPGLAVVGDADAFDQARAQNHARHQGRGLALEEGAHSDRLVLATETQTV